MKSTIALINKNILFSTYTSEDISTFIAKGIIKIVKYKKGQTLHTALDACLRIDLLLSGSLTAYNLAENGSAISVFNFCPNDLVGANLLFSNINKYPLNIYCTSHCTVAYVEKEDVAKLLASNSSFSMEYIKVISNYSISLNRKMLTFNHKTLRERILEYLDKQFLIQGSKEIKLPITKKQLADELGVQRPSLFRELKKLKEEGFIDYSNKNIKLKG